MKKSGMVESSVLELVLVESFLDRVGKVVTIRNVLPSKVSDFFEPEVEVSKNALAVPSKSGV